MLAIARVVSFALLALSLFGGVEASSAARHVATNAERITVLMCPSLLVLRCSSGGAIGRSRVDTMRTRHSGVIALYASGMSPSSGASPVAWLGQYQVVAGSSAAWPYEFTQPTPSDAAVELQCVASPNYVLGAMPNGETNHAQLGSGLTNYIRFVNVGVHTPAGATTGAFNPGAYQVGYAETTIFSIDEDTGKITVE
ncbi:hypothetical protein BD414DRAFT_507436 [Trametes punicea]|nr:hypothetical protein BD414DRAFT_507436 [Trametes punicea]